MCNDVIGDGVMKDLEANPEFPKLAPANENNFKKEEGPHLTDAETAAIEVLLASRNPFYCKDEYEKRFAKAIAEEGVKCVKKVLDAGYTDARIEKAFGFGKGTVHEWLNGKEMLPEEISLFRILGAYPSLVKWAEMGYEKINTDRGITV